MCFAQADRALVAQHVVADADADLVRAGQADATILGTIVIKSLQPSRLISPIDAICSLAAGCQCTGMAQAFYGMVGMLSSRA